MQALTNEKKKIIFSIVLVLISLVMIFLIRPILTNPDTYTLITNILDEKKSNVTGLLAASTSTSTLITLIPGDVGTPIADQLAQLSSLFLLILSFLYMEKYLLTLIGALLAWGIAISSILVLVSIWLPKDDINQKLHYISQKLVIFVTVLFLVIPISTTVTHMVDLTYESSIQETVNTAVDSQTQEEVTQETDESKSWWENVADTLTSAVTSVSESAQQTYEWAQSALNNFVEATAVMIVTSCVIPLLTLVIVVWMAKTILENSTGKSIPVSTKQIPVVNKYLPKESNED